MTHPPKLYADALPIALSPRYARDLAAAIEAASSMARAVRAVTEMFRRSSAEWQRQIRVVAEMVANDPHAVAGLTSRYIVRAGLDPAYRTDEGIRALVSGLLHGTEYDARYLTPENRALVAAAAIYGWSESYLGPRPETLAWHREMGGVRVLVGRSA